MTAYEQLFEERDCERIKPEESGGGYVTVD